MNPPFLVVSNGPLGSGRGQWSIQLGDAQYNIGESADFAQMASSPDSPVLMRMASSMLDTKIFPSPMRPVCAARRMALDQFIGNHYFDLNLGQEVHNVLGAAVQFGMALLPTKSLGFGDGNALQSDFLKRFFDLVELEWLDDGFDFFHGSPPGHFHIADFRLVSTLRE
jgi:hypothetical protein